MIRLLTAYVESRRKVRRADFAIALLRKEAADMRRREDRNLARYLERVADLIERTP